jgi:hypothetical protein
MIIKLVAFVAVATLCFLNWIAALFFLVITLKEGMSVIYDVYGGGFALLATISLVSGFLSLLFLLDRESRRRQRQPFAQEPWQAAGSSDSSER